MHLYCPDFCLIYLHLLPFCVGFFDMLLFFSFVTGGEGPHVDHLCPQSKCVSILTIIVPYIEENILMGSGGCDGSTGGGSG